MLRLCYLRYLNDSVSRLTEIRALGHGKRTFNRSVIPTKTYTSVIMTNDVDIKKCFEVAKDVTLEAGKIFKVGYEGEKIVKEKKSSWDLVTEYDVKIEEVLTKRLKAEFPDHVIIGEESMAAEKEMPPLTDKPTWFLDPIDGTLNYVHSFPHCCISVGLAVRKHLVLGIIYDPVQSELYTAIKGEGAFLNDKPIHTSKVTELKMAFMELSPFALRFPSKNRDIRLGRFEAMLEASQGTRSIGSAAMALAYIARGSLDCYHSEFLKPWDIAAGVLIVQEAGGAVINTTTGNDFDFMDPKLITAANETLADQLKQLIIDTDLKTLRKRLSKA